MKNPESDSKGQSFKPFPLWHVAPLLAGNVHLGLSPIVRVGDPLSMRPIGYGRTQREVLALFKGEQLIGNIPDRHRFDIKTLAITYRLEFTAHLIGDRYCEVRLRLLTRSRKVLACPPPPVVSR
jgi:hypothetical protein